MLPILIHFGFKFHIVGVHSLLHVTSLLNLLGNNDENLDTNNKIKTGWKI